MVPDMEKTYKLLNHDSSLPIDEIRRLYKGYWVYLVNVKLSEFNGILSGKPVVMGITPFDGVEDGIYEKFDTDEYVHRADLNLLVNKTLASLLQLAGDSCE